MLIASERPGAAGLIVAPVAPRAIR